MMAGSMLAALAVVAVAAPPRPGAPPRPLRFACPEALADGTLVDPRQAGPLASLAAGLKWESGDPFGPPTDCHRQVRLVCGPDLDGDGDPEAIVEVSWWFSDDCAAAAREDGGGVPVMKTFLASRHRAVWRAVAPLSVASSDEVPRESVALSAAGAGAVAPAPRRSYFVRRPRGETGVRVEWSSATSDTGCALGGYQVFALRAGALHQVEAGDSARLCAPCGCHDP
jgi:hypothetical protein